MSDKSKESKKIDEAQEVEDPDQEQVSLNRELSHLNMEGRMILPGIQTLFGFQLVIVFNERFASILSSQEQYLHIGALSCSAFAAMLIMIPAAYHRQASRGIISKEFTKMSSKMITRSLFPFALGMSIDFGLIVRVVSGNYQFAVILAGAILACYLYAWFIFPQMAKKKNRI